MALSANANWVTQDLDKIGTKTMVVLSAAVVYNTALCSLNTSEGEVKPFDGTQTDRLVGWHFGDSVTGNASGSRILATICPGGFIVRNLTTGGLLNTTADYGADVYASDDGTYTVTDPGSGVVVGRIVADNIRDTGKANVYFHNLGQR